jgi:hypothetical protein
MTSTKTIVGDAQREPDLNLSMQDAITGYLRARDQYLQSMDALDAFVFATNVLYVAFAEDIGIADRRILCNAFQSFRKALIRHCKTNQAVIHITTLQ